MWYYRTVLAAIEDAINALKTKGVSEDIVSNLESMTDVALKGKYIGALMQNPLISWDELQNKFQNNQSQKVSNAELNFLTEMRKFINQSNLSEEQSANFYRWLERVALPSYRPNQHDPNNFTYPKFSQMVNPLYGVQVEISHIFDWYVEHIDENPRFNIFSLSLDQALQASNSWHEELRNQDTSGTFTKIQKLNGKIIDPNVEMIFDEAKLKSLGLSDEYNGWMIVKLSHKKDFDLEGKIMGHCVGTNNYHSRYEKGWIEVLSLRDESNKPHATIEIELPDIVQQIQGKGNTRPKEDYLKMILAWINEKKYYSSESSAPTLDFYTGMNEERALENINEFISPYHDEELTDELGVPYREVSRSEEEFLDEFNLDNFVEQIGQTSNDYYKTFQDIPDDEKFEDLISFLGNLFIGHDVEFLKNYLSKPESLGASKSYFEDELYILKAKDKLVDNIAAQMVNVNRTIVNQIFKETGIEPKSNNYDSSFRNKSAEEINALAQQPYQSRPARFSNRSNMNNMKEYDGVYDCYPVYFYDSLYDYMRKNMPKEFYEMINKLVLNFDFSEITPSSALEESKKIDERADAKYHFDKNQNKLFDVDNDKLQKWTYAYNHKNYNTAGKK